MPSVEPSSSESQLPYQLVRSRNNRLPPARFRDTAYVYGVEARPPSSWATATSWASAFAALNLDASGNPLTYRTAKAGPNAANWFIAEGEEFRRLFDTQTMRPLYPTEQPADRRPDTTYYNPQTKEKVAVDGSITRRIRGTAGGNILKHSYPGETSARTADMEVVKALIHSAASDRSRDSDSGRFLTLDIKDFYLGAPLDRPEFVRINLRFIPPEIVDEYKLQAYIHNDAILFQIDKCMYGLPQAGFISQRQLFKHLALHGYEQDPNVPCLFRHNQRQITFTLVVDDFAVKYALQNDADHLIATLRLLYTIKIDWTGCKYLGYTIKFNDTTQSVSLSMPDYIPKMLERFFPDSPLSGASSPALYTPPDYGSHAPQLATHDDTAPLDATEIRRLQEIVGCVLFYARAVDCTMLPAITHIASDIAHPTRQVMQAAIRLLRYAASYPCHELVFNACDMQLCIQSDASYLSRTNARSVAGGIHYCGNKDSPPSYLNGALLAVSCVIPTVCSSVAEAEYAALYLNARHGVWLRTILTALGYAQRPTPVLCDNTCAIGIANDTVKARRSKAIDMRYHWVREHIRHGDLKVSFCKGVDNIADFFTKPLPVAQHQYLKPKLVYCPPLPHNTALPPSARRAHTSRLLRLMTSSPRSSSGTTPI